MKTSWRLLIVIVLFGSALAVGLIVSERGRASEIVLADGSIVQLVGAIDGNGTFTTEKNWHRFLRKNLDRKYLKWIPAARTMRCGSAKALSLYFSRVKIPTNGVRGAFWSRVQVLEEGGYKHINSPGYCSTSAGNGAQLVSLGLRSFPRRQSEFPVLIYDRDDSLVAEFLVKNPIKKEFPVWESSPFPITNVIQSTRVVMKGFTLHENNFGGYWRPHIEVDSVDGTESPMRFRYHRFSDPTGNEGSVLSPTEPVWKSTVKLYRPKKSKIPDQFRGHFDMVEVPSGGEVLPRNQVIEIDGIDLRLVFFSGPGVTTITNGVSFHADLPERPLSGGSHSSSSSGRNRTESWESDHHFLVIETEDPGKDVEFLFQLFDQDGNKLERVNQFHGYEGGNLRPPYARRYTFPVSLSESVTSMRMDVVLNRGLSFEFLVDSSRLPTEVSEAP